MTSEDFVDEYLSYDHFVFAMDTVTGAGLLLDVSATDLEDYSKISETEISKLGVKLAEWLEEIGEEVVSNEILDLNMPYCKAMTRSEEMTYYYNSRFEGAVLTMIGTYKVITLCGSTRFKEAFLAAQKRLTLEGNIVISVGLFGHSGDSEAMDAETKAMLDDMHKRKIDMADEIYVINVGGYIGSSTKSEIEYAKANEKGIRYLEV